MRTSPLRSSSCQRASRTRLTLTLVAWAIAGTVEGRARAAAPDASARISTSVMLAQAEVRAGHLETAGALLTIARGLVGDGKLAASDRAALELAEAELVYARAFLVGPPYDAAVDALRAALRRAEQSGDRGLVAEAQDLLALALDSRGKPSSDAAEGRALLESALAARRASGRACDIAETLFHLGLVHEHRDPAATSDLAQARAHYEEALAVATSAECRYEASFAERHLAGLAADRGDLTAARRGFERSLALRRAAGAALVIAPALTALADVLAEQGQSLQARALYEEAIETAQRIGSPRFEKAAAVGLNQLTSRALPPLVTASFAALSVSDVDRVAAWYTQLLGFSVEIDRRSASGGPKAMLLSRDGARLELLEFPTAKSRQGWGLDAEAHELHGILKIGFVVADLDALYATAQSRQLTLFFPLVTPEGSSLRTFGLLDPDGNIVQIFGK